MKSEATTKKLNIATNVNVYFLKSAASVAASVCGHAVWPMSMPGSVVLSLVGDRGRVEKICQTESKERRVVANIFIYIPLSLKHKPSRDELALSLDLDFILNIPEIWLLPTNVLCLCERGVFTFSMVYAQTIRS